MSADRFTQIHDHLDVVTSELKKLNDSQSERHVPYYRWERGAPYAYYATPPATCPKQEAWRKDYAFCVGCELASRGCPFRAQAPYNIMASEDASIESTSGRTLVELIKAGEEILDPTTGKTLTSASPIFRRLYGHATTD